jgi:hypothetical protein
MRPSGRAETSGAPPAQAFDEGLFDRLAGEHCLYGDRHEIGVLVERQSGLLEGGGAPSRMSFSSFLCARLVSTTTGMCMVAGFSFRAFRTFGPLILGSILSSRIL